jgi:hypothetical protein
LVRPPWICSRWGMEAIVNLTSQQQQSYEQDGYLAPLEFLPADQMAELRQTVSDSLGRKAGPQGGDRWGSRHQDCRIVYDICASPAIVDPVSAFLGPDVVLWNSVFFNKEPGGNAIPWHQDRGFTMMEPVINIAVWLAIDDATIENGCLQVIPGSHRSFVPHVTRTKSDDFNAHAEVSEMDTAKARHIELRAGQFILFHENILHHSPVNASTKRRQGLAIRYTVPSVRIKTDQLFPGYFVYPVKGSHVNTINTCGTVPKD